MRSNADTPASLFIYFKLPRDHAQEAGQRLAAIQARLRSLHPGLCARLLSRTDNQEGGELTWMEIYEHPVALPRAFLSDLQAALQGLPADLIGPRHTESFSELCPAAGPAT